MSVGFTCPAVRAQDPIAVENDEKPGPCVGHDGPCRIMHTPRQPIPQPTTETTEETE